MIRVGQLLNAPSYQKEIYGITKVKVISVSEKYVYFEASLRETIGCGIYVSGVTIQEAKGLVIKHDQNMIGEVFRQKRIKNVLQEKKD